MSEWSNRVSKNPASTNNLQEHWIYDVSGNVEYYFSAKPGTLPSEKKWQIVKYFYDVSNRVIEKVFANDNENFAHIADNYLDFEYTRKFS